MADSKTINDAIENIVRRYKQISRGFVRRIVEQIKKIGELSPSRMHDLIVMRDMTMDIADLSAGSSGDLCGSEVQGCTEPEAAGRIR